MTFQEWVDENGGQSAVAKAYGFTSSLVGSWYRFERFPRTDNLTLLIAYSEGKINVQQWAADFAARSRELRDGLTQRQKRIKGNLPVNSLNRLAALRSMQSAFESNPMVIGTQYFGNFVITNIDDAWKYFGPAGSPRVIEVGISMIEAGDNWLTDSIAEVQNNGVSGVGNVLRRL